MFPVYIYVTYGSEESFPQVPCERREGRTIRRFQELLGAGHGHGCRWGASRTRSWVQGGAIALCEARVLTGEKKEANTR